MEDVYLLLVDDNPENLKFLGSILKKKGFRLAFALNGAQALASLEKEQPDLILLDVMMPEMDGFEVCGKIKADPILAHIPIIFLTAKTDSESIIKGFQLGGTDYVTKPFNPQELLVRIDNQLQIKFGREIIAKQTIELEKSNHVQQELLHILCHDLANPMGNILNLVDLMEVDPDFRDQGLAVIQKSAHQGLEVIDLIRMMRNVQEFSLERSPVNLYQALCDSEETLMTRLQSKDIVLINGVPRGLMVLAEEVSLVNSVLNNILTNAIKFSHQGNPIEVRVREVNEQVILELEDHGIGIPAALLEQLFTIGVKTSRLGTEDEIGTGFGMPLVQEFMHAYGGEIQVFSQDIEENPEQHGTRIVLTFQRG